MTNQFRPIFEIQYIRYLILHSLFFTLLAFSSIDVYSYTTPIGGVEYWPEYLNGTAKVNSLSYDNYSQNIVIPDSIEINGKIYIVNEIMSRAFSDNSRIVSCSLPETIKSIGEEAFSGCKNLESIVIPSQVRKIEKKTFLECTSLKSIVLPERIDSIKEKAFFDCANLTEIQWPSKLYFIGFEAFYGCKALQYVKFPSTLQGLAEYTFMNSGIIEADFTGCGSLYKLSQGTFACCFNLSNVILSPGLYTLGIDAFSSCSNLKSIILPPTLVTLEGGYDRVFGGCKIQKGAYSTEIKDVQFPTQWSQYPYISNLTEDGFIYNKDNSVLYYAPLEIESYVSPDNLVSISNSAFFNCKLLYDLKLSESLELIGNYAFKGCSSLTSVEIPENVTQIGAFAFHNTGLKSLIYNAVNCSFDSNTGSKEVTPFYNVGIEKLTIGQNVKTIPNYAFCSNSIEELILPDSVIELGEYCFSYNKISNIQFGSKITAIPHSCFSINKISELSIPSNITEIGMDAFDNNDLQNLSFEDTNNPLQIINYPFGDITSYKRYRIPNLYLGRDLSYNSLSNLDFDHIEIGEKVTDAQALDCKLYPSLKSINSLAKTPPLLQPLDDEQYKRIEVSVPTDAMAAYCTDSIWKNFFNIPIEKIELPSYKEVYYESGRIFPKLDVILTPYYATEPALTWTTSDENVVYINQKGLFITNGIGECTITASLTNNPDIFAECKIKVLPVLIESMDLNPQEWTGQANETFFLTSSILPSNATITDLIWSSSDESVATAENYGGNTCYVTTHNIGDCIITASSDDGSEISATCLVHVVPTQVTSIEVNPTEWEGREGTSFKIEASVSPATATDKTLRWESLDPNVATVDENGIVITHNAGHTLIRVYTSNTAIMPATCEVTVNPTLSAEISIEPYLDIQPIGTTFEIVANILPENTTNKKLVWSSSDTNIATVDQQGNVSTHNYGTCYIRVATTDGTELWRDCPITVASILINPTEWEGIEGSTFTANIKIQPLTYHPTFEVSSNDENVAIIDNSPTSVNFDGFEFKVSILNEGSCVITAKTTDGSNLSAECIITSTAGIDDVFADGVSFDVYSIQGALIDTDCTRDDLKKLSSGVYILRSGNKSSKIIIR